jgi:5-methylcytosine-specific restriction endonuclease McrA
MADATLCVVDECSSQRRKRGWCDRHYQAWRRHGSPTGMKYEWKTKAAECLMCGSVDLMPSSRSYCSKSCLQAAYRARKRGWSWESRPCIGCGEPITMERVAGKFSTSVLTRYHRECRGARRSYRLAVKILAHYQGNRCGICHEPIDMSRSFPDRMSASIDHKVPLSYGGTDEIENLQLAHFSCNASKKVKHG